MAVVRANGLSAPLFLQVQFVMLLRGDEEVLGRVQRKPALLGRPHLRVVFEVERVVILFFDALGRAVAGIATRGAGMYGHGDGAGGRSACDAPGSPHCK